jgi:tetratricopeptide (TPR) repeat protein
VANGADAEAALRRGDEMQRRGDRSGAEAAYRVADEAGSGEGASNLGALLFERNEVAAAEACLRRADERGSAWGSFRLGFLLDERGELAAAESAYQRAIARGNPHAEGNLLVLRERIRATQAVETALRSLPHRTYELFELVHGVSMTADALTNRNHFPMGSGISTAGEVILPTRGAPPEDMEYVLLALRSYAQQGKIVAAAVAAKGRGQIKGAPAGEGRDVVTVFVEDITAKRWCFYRQFKRTAAGWTFGDLQVEYLGASRLFAPTP